MTVNFKILILLVLPPLLACCSHRYIPPKVESTNFLNDYFLLTESGEDDALLSYWKIGVNWRKYKKIIVAPVVLFKTNDTEFNQMTHAEGYRLTEMLDYKIQESLKNGFKRVNNPGDDTLSLQFVITDIDKMAALLKNFSSIYRSARVFDSVKPSTADKQSISEKIGIEGKITDSTTGELLMTSADGLIGGKTLVGFSGEWEDIDLAYQYWATHLGYQLCVRQGHLDCKKVEPK